MRENDGLLLLKYNFIGFLVLHQCARFRGYREDARDTLGAVHTERR